LCANLGRTYVGDGAEQLEMISRGLVFPTAFFSCLLTRAF
jgi:hypothetical protein